MELDAFGVDTFCDKVVGDGFGAIFGKTEVVGDGAMIVGVAANFDAHFGVVCQKVVEGE